MQNEGERAREKEKPELGILRDITNLTNGTNPTNEWVWSSLYVE